MLYDIPPTVMLRLYGNVYPQKIDIWDMLGDTTGRMMQGQLILFTTQIHVKEMYKKRAKYVCFPSIDLYKLEIWQEMKTLFL